MKKLLLLGSVILGFLVLLSHCSVRSFVYIPPKPEDESTYLRDFAPWESFRRSFTRDNAVLSGWFVEKKGQPLLVYYGGNSMDVGNMLPYLSSFPCAKLLVNYRGYGLSTGEPTENDLIADALAVLDEILAESGRSPEDVILVGQSLGSGVATQVAAARKVKKLVLLVPFDSLLATAEDLFPNLPVKTLLPDHFRSDLAAPHVSCPVSILAAGDDEVIPPVHARRLRDCFTVPVDYIEFPGVHHNSIWHGENFDEVFAEKIGCKRP